MAASSTPTEAAAIGAFGTGVIATFNGRAVPPGSRPELPMLNDGQRHRDDFLIVFGAGVYNAVPGGSASCPRPPRPMSASRASPLDGVRAVVPDPLLIFGCVMDSLSMILLTVPIFFPIMSALDFRPDARGIRARVFSASSCSSAWRLDLITPPVGMNLFVIKFPMAKDTAAVRPPIAAWVSPSSWTDIIRVAILTCSRP